MSIGPALDPRFSCRTCCKIECNRRDLVINQGRAPEKITCKWWRKLPGVPLTRDPIFGTGKQ